MIGKVRTTIRLQPKGQPEKPEALTPVAVGHNFVTLRYTPGFDGGVHDTMYFVSYKRAADSGEDDCVNARRIGAPDSWHEVDCQRNNPCNVTSLDQHQRYIFKVWGVKKRFVIRVYKSSYRRVFIFGKLYCSIFSTVNF